MKKAMKKLLCVVLVLMIAIPFAVFPASAEASAQADTLEPLYEVDFRGNDGTLGAFTKGWKTKIMGTASSDGKSIVIEKTDTSTSSNRYAKSALSATLSTETFSLLDNAYTMVFTLTPENDLQEIGLLLDHCNGFIITPASNGYRFVEATGGEGVNDNTWPSDNESYEGEKTLTNTYAIEIATEGEKGNVGDKNWAFTAYNLYCLADDGEWVCLYELSDEELAAVEWDFGWYVEGGKDLFDEDLCIRFYRNRTSKNSALDKANNAKMTVSNMSIYGGLAASSGALNVETRAYYLASDGGLLYTANFNGDSVLQPWDGNWEAWAGMATSDVILGGEAVVLKPTVSSQAASFRGYMDPTNYPVKGNSYTMVFTATASDKEQEIGLYADWSTGYVVIPGKNQFRYNRTESDRTVNTEIVGYTDYEGTGALTQTYAVEFKLNEDSFSAAEYNLYVAQNGKWVLLYSLDADELADGPNWSEGEPEVVIGFYRDSKIANQNGTVTVSDFKVYKGLAAKSGAAVAPANAVHYSYDDAAYGDLIYVPDFNGDAVLRDPSAGWTGMHTSFNVAADGKTVAIKSTWSSNGKGGVWGAKLNGYGMLGNSYTTVFTVTASDNDEEIAFLPDHWAGFAVNPGQNTYRFINTNGADGTDEEIESGTYVGNGALTQTYAIEIKSEGTSLEDMNLTAYNLYVARNGEWQLVHAFTAAELDEITFDWGAAMDNDNDFVLRFYQLRDDDNPNDKMSISNYALYKGLGATIGAIPAEFNAVSYENAKDGDLLYNVNFSGDSIFSGKDGWAGMDEKNATATSVDLYTKKDDKAATEGTLRANVWGADLKGYEILGKSFTAVFTVTASDADQEVGFLPCDWAGFVVTPGANAYRFITIKDGDSGTEGEYENVIADGTYNGTGALTQTYAVEFASDADGEYLTAYNLYVLMDGVWVLVCELDANQMDISYFDWFYEYEEGGETLYEEDFTVRFYRSYYVRGEDGWATEEVGNQTGKITISDMKIYRGNDILPEVGLINGASVRLDDPTGIRFTGSITKEYYNELSKDGKVVTLGVLIAPTDYIFDNQIAFTKEAFDAARVQYLTIDGTLREEATYYKVNCAMVNMNEGNYERDFSARLYVAVDGEIVAYSAYSHANNSRSIATVAERAYNDVSTTQNNAYKNAITIGDIAVSYSPYTAEERAILGTFFDATPDSSISVMTYNIKGTSSDREEKRDITKAYSFIANSGVDVIGLQEDDDYNASAILKLNSDYALVSGSKNGNGNEDNAILYNTTKFKVLNSGGSVYFKKLVDTKDVYQQVFNITVTGKEYIDTDYDGEVDKAAGDEVTVNPNFDYDQMGDEEGWGSNKEHKGRFFRWVVLEDIKTGVQYIVVNTHLHYRKTSTASDKDSEASSPMNKAVRQAQAMLIKLWLENDATAKQYPNSIVMGDLNGQHDSNVLNSLTDNGALRQARDEAVMILDDWGTFVESDANKKLYMEREKWIFDHVVYNSDALVAAKYTVVDNKLTGADAAKANYPSDHLPVVAEFYYYN